MKLRRTWWAARGIVAARAAVASVCLLGFPAASMAVVVAPAPVASAAVAVPGVKGTAGPEAGGSSLESAASRAGETGRKVAMSLIGLALAIAAVVLAFRRDFREAAAVFAVGLVCILLATPAGMNLLSDTVKALVGS